MNIIVCWPQTCAQHLLHQPNSLFDRGYSQKAILSMLQNLSEGWIKSLSSLRRELIEKDTKIIKTVPKSSIQILPRLYKHCYTIFQSYHKTILLIQCFLPYLNHTFGHLNPQYRDNQLVSAYLSCTPSI